MSGESKNNLLGFIEELVCCCVYDERGAAVGDGSHTSLLFSPERVGIVVVGIGGGSGEVGKALEQDQLEQDQVYELDQLEQNQV